MSQLTSSVRSTMRNRQFAFPAQRKEPIENASHVRNAVARFDQVQGVSKADRDDAWQRIRAAARKFGVHLRDEAGRHHRRLGRVDPVARTVAP